jgi:hypothetical protein
MGNWIRIKGINRINLSGIALRFCYIGVSYFILEHRNSYHGYSSARYGESPFYLKLLDAKKFIQKNRNRGSSWEIQQAPVIVLVFDKMQISINFAEWDDCNFIISLNSFANSESKISLKKIIRYLSSLRGVYFYKDINKSIENMTERLVNYRSYIYDGIILWEANQIESNIPIDYLDLLKLIWPLTKAHLKK